MVFVPGPVMIDGLGARIMVYGCCMFSHPAHSIWYIPTRVGVVWEIHTWFAIFCHHQGLPDWYIVRDGRLQGLFRCGKRCQIAQLMNGGKDEWEVTMLVAGQCLGRRNPYAIACLQAIIGRLLLGGSRREEEVCVVALGHDLRRNPVGEVAQVIGG